MNVLLVSHASDLSGAARDLLELARALQGAEHVQTTVVLPKDGPLRAALEAAGVPVVRVRHGWWLNRRAPFPRRAWSLLANTVSVVRLRRLIHRLETDIVLTGTLAIPWAAVAARLADRPHIWYVQELADQGLTFHFGRDRSMRMIGELSDIVAACSKAVAVYLEQWISPDKIRVLRYAFDVPGRDQTALPAGDGELRLVLVGTKLQGKGQDEALAALARLRAAGVPAHLRLVGPGRRPYVRQLEQAAQGLGVEAHVDFVDSVPDAGPELEAADIALVCSSSEGFSRVVVEAMRKEVPVVGARTTGTEEQLVESGGGLLYEPGNAADLAAAVERLYRDPALRGACAQRGAAWTQQFSLERFGTEFLALADEAIERHREVDNGSHR